MTLARKFNRKFIEIFKYRMGRFDTVLDKYFGFEIIGLINTIITKINEIVVSTACDMILKRNNSLSGSADTRPKVSCPQRAFHIAPLEDIFSQTINFVLRHEYDIFVSKAMNIQILPYSAN